MTIDKFLYLADIPARDYDATRSRVVFDKIDDVCNLIDILTARPCPAPPALVLGGLWDSQTALSGGDSEGGDPELDLYVCCSICICVYSMKQDALVIHVIGGAWSLWSSICIRCING